jgi:predicted O-linked N-acetylglucosamine transferase (SPINDLY family)
MSATLTRKLNQAWDRLQQGDAAGAQYLCRDILKEAPSNPEALYLLGVVQLMSGLPKDAVRTLEQALAGAPGDGPTLESLGLAHLMLGDHAAAERPLREAAALPGAPASVLMRLGFALLHLQKFDEAVAALEQAAAREPQNPDIHVNLGLAMSRRGDAGAARRHFETALRCAPDHPDATYNLGALCMEQKQFDEARQWFERVVARAGKQTPPEALEGLAVANSALGRNQEAIVHLRKLLAAEPQRAGALGTLAQALFQTGQLDEAAATAQRSLALDPQDAAVHSTLADVYFIKGDLVQGTAALEAGFAATGALRLLGTLRFEYRRQCDWPKWRTAWQQLAPALADTTEPVSPFSLLCEDTSPAQQRVYAERWCALQYPAAADGSAPAAARPARPGGRLRIGYLSSDLHEHATAYLIAEVLELHDRSRFEVFAYSYGPEDKSPMRARLRAACEHFTDIAWDPDDIAARHIREDALDVLVDLKGYTLGARTAILARRPCAVQINWLGYPGTMGAPFIDYVIADPVVIPRDAEADYRERVLRLPHCYQPNDRRRSVADPRSRAAYGLPASGVVFCCFNQAYKITPELFACWMRLLAQTPGSALWLLEDNVIAKQNLQAAATAAGIDPSRLVFGPKLPLAEHLARYRVADLALDTFPYTSHTTASDALWAGCPLVALRGATFAARVSASILTAGEMPELIADTRESYEALAQHVAADAAYRADLRARLAVARERSPLFDTAGFTRDLEALYQGIGNG